MRLAKFLDELYNDEYVQRLEGTSIQYSVKTEAGVTFNINANSCDSPRQFYYKVLDAYNRLHPSWQARYRDLTIQFPIVKMAPNNSSVHLVVAARSISDTEQSLLNGIYSPADVNDALANFYRANSMIRRPVSDSGEVNSVIGQYEEIIDSLSPLVCDLDQRAGGEDKRNSLYTKFKEMYDDLRLKLIEVHTGSLKQQCLNSEIFAHLPSEKLTNIVLAYAACPTIIPAYKDTDAVVRSYQRYIVSQILLNRNVLPLPSVLSHMVLEYYDLPGVGQFQRGAIALSKLSLFSVRPGQSAEVQDLSLGEMPDLPEPK